jgi:hypothetical protein
MGTPRPKRSNRNAVKARRVDPVPEAAVSILGPVPIRKRLQEQSPEHDWPSVSTIGAILKRNGMVKPRRRRMRVAPRTQPFSNAREPNDIWCVDFKGNSR